MRDCTGWIDKGTTDGVSTGFGDGIRDGYDGL